jgi:hypothetical protein
MTESKIHFPEPTLAADSSPARFATANTVRRQRRIWSGRVATWDQHGIGRVAEGNRRGDRPGGRLVLTDMMSGRGA